MGEMLDQIKSYEADSIEIKELARKILYVMAFVCCCLICLGVIGITFGSIMMDWAFSDTEYVLCNNDGQIWPTSYESCWELTCGTPCYEKIMECGPTSTGTTVDCSTWCSSCHQYCHDSVVTYNTCECVSCYPSITFNFSESYLFKGGAIIFLIAGVLSTLSICICVCLIGLCIVIGIVEG